MSTPARLALYDFDGTLVSGNVVRRYAFFARHHPSKLHAVLKCTKLVTSVPLLIGLDFLSRPLFNEYFYREYRGMRREWLLELSEQLFREEIQPSIYPRSKELVEADRSQGFRLVLVTGELDFALGEVARYFGFDAVIANTLVYEKGAATGEITRPLIATEEKARAIQRLCREYNVKPEFCKAYSDSFSDAPMLESVGHPIAVNPDRRLRRVALQRGWPIVDLRNDVPSVPRS